MKGGRFSPMLQVGAEGVIESSLCAAIVLPLVSLLPGSDHDHVEEDSQAGRPRSSFSSTLTTTFTTAPTPSRPLGRGTR